MGIRDTFEAERAKIDAKRTKQEREARERQDALARRSDRNAEMLSVLLKGLAADWGYLEGQGFRMASEPHKLTIHGPGGNVSVAVVNDHEHSGEFLIRPTSIINGSLAEIRSQTPEAALQKLGWALAQIKDR